MTEKKWILVSDGTPQMAYAGKTDLTEEQIDERIMQHKTVELTECRAMRTILIPGQDPNHPITQSNILTSHNIARGGVRMKILPTNYWWPEEDKNALAVLERQAENCAQAELATRAREAGLETGTDVATEVARQIAVKDGLRAATK
jgi:hypothetical protein